jgi:hypothetical protein
VTDHRAETYGDALASVCEDLYGDFVRPARTASRGCPVRGGKGT